MNLALRESDELIIQQDEVDYFYALQRPAWIALPVLRMSRAENDSTNKPGAYTIESNYPPILDAWGGGEVRIGEDRVDRWFADAGASSVERLDVDAPDGFAKFYVQYDEFVSWRVLEAGIQEVPDTRFEAGHYQPPEPPDITLAWDGDDAVLTFLVGWGDCMVQCSGTHSWEARVSPELEVTIEDLGGGPVPEDFLQAAEQRPPPR